MSNLALLLLTAAASLLAASAVSLVPTTCDACRTVVEEYFQRYMEAAHEHRRHGLALNRAGPRTWWNKAETKPVESDVSFEKRLEVTCDASRLGMYKPLIRQTCEEILLHPASGVNHKLTHLYSTNETYHPELKLGPGRRMHVWRVAGMKWHVCTQLFDHCDENTLGHRTTLTDRCGMCHNLAVDLLYLVRRGEPGPDVTRFFESMVADLCLVRAAFPCAAGAGGCFVSFLFCPAVCAEDLPTVIL